MEIHGKLIDLDNEEIFSVTLTIEAGIIKDIQPNSHRGLGFILPGFVDGSTHLESTFLPPSEFARLCVRHGCTSAHIDPSGIPPDLLRSPFPFSHSPPMPLPATLSEARQHLEDQTHFAATSKTISQLFPLFGDPLEMSYLATDKPFPHELLGGQIDSLAKQAIQAGGDPFAVLRSACGHKTLSVGDDATFTIIEDLFSFRVVTTYIKGETELLKTTYSPKPAKLPPLPPLDIDTPAPILLRLPRSGGAPIITTHPTSHITHGAIASSVSFPDHDIAALATNPKDLTDALTAVLESGGGLALAHQGKVDHFPLLLHGLFSLSPAEEVARKFADFEEAAKSFGSSFRDLL